MKNSIKLAIIIVIAVILLIGLAVAVVATIFIFILPLLPPTSSLQIDDAYINYDDATTTAADVGEGYGNGTLILSNTGTGDIEIDSLQVYYGSSIVGPWTEIENHKLTISGHAGAITGTNPYILETFAALDELTVGFPIPEENDNNTISYKITITSSEGASFDTSTQASVAATDMQLSKDRPDISFIGTLGSLRRTEREKIRPGDIDDNSVIKNVTYRVYSDLGGLLVREKTIEPPIPLWTWVWDTRNDTAEGLNNGSYSMTMTVYDYAGLSAQVDNILFTIDNDYIPPVISNIISWSLIYGQGIAKQGDPYFINATITDSGSEISAVKEAGVYFKINGTGTNYSLIAMHPISSDIWNTTISESFINETAVLKNITFYLTAKDFDGNLFISDDYYIDVRNSSSVYSY